MKHAMFYKSKEEGMSQCDVILKSSMTRGLRWLWLALALFVYSPCLEDKLVVKEICSRTKHRGTMKVILNLSPIYLEFGKIK